MANYGDGLYGAGLYGVGAFASQSEPLSGLSGQSTTWNFTYFRGQEPFSALVPGNITAFDQAAVVDTTVQIGVSSSDALITTDAITTLAIQTVDSGLLTETAVVAAAISATDLFQTISSEVVAPAAPVALSASIAANATALAATSQLRGVASVASTGTSMSSLACAAPTGLLAGDTLLALVFMDATNAVSTVTPPTGWTAIRASGDTSARVAIASFTKKASGSEPGSYTFSLTPNTDLSIAILCYEGQNVAAAVDQSNTTESTALVTPAVAATVTPTGPTDMLVVAAVGSISATYTTPSGLVLEATPAPQANQSSVVYDVPLTSAATTQPYSITPSVAVRYNTQTIALLSSTMTATAGGVAAGSGVLGVAFVFSGAATATATTTANGVAQWHLSNNQSFVTAINGISTVISATGNTQVLAGTASGAATAIAHSTQQLLAQPISGGATGRATLGTIIRLISVPITGQAVALASITPWTFFQDTPVGSQPAGYSFSYVGSPSVDGRAIAFGLTGAGGPYSGAAMHLFPSTDANVTSLRGACKFQIPATAFNNFGSPSIIQTLEFTLAEFTGTDPENVQLTVGWMNVVSGAAGAATGPFANTGMWSYWDNTNLAWHYTGLQSALAPGVFHSLEWAGWIDAAHALIHYHHMTIDEHFIPLGYSYPYHFNVPANGVLMVQFQLDGNSTQSPYTVYYDDIELMWGDTIWWDRTYLDVIVGDHPVCYYQLDEEHTTTIRDASGYAIVGQPNNQATANGGVGLAEVVGPIPAGKDAESAPIQRAASFSAVDFPTITAADNSSLNFGSGSFSIEGWVNYDPIVDPQWWISKGFPYNHKTAGWGVTNWLTSVVVDSTTITTLGPQLFISDGTTVASLASTTALSTGVWHHVVFVVDKGQQKMFCYTDGLPNGSASLPGGFGSVSSTSTLLIGSLPPIGQAAVFFTGSLAHIALYNYALTAAQVANHFNPANLLS